MGNKIPAPLLESEGCLERIEFFEAAEGASGYFVGKTDHLFLLVSDI